MNRALTKADIVEAIYEKTDRNWSDEAGHQEG